MFLSSLGEIQVVLPTTLVNVDNLTFGGRNPKGSHPFLVTLGTDMEFYQSTVAPEDTTTRVK